MRSQYTVVLVIATLLSLASNASAQVYEWTNSAGGVFSNVANWTLGGPPNSAAETGMFDLQDAYTVTFNGIANFGTLNQTSGTVNFVLNGWTLTPASTTGNSVGSNVGATTRILGGAFRPGGYNVATAAGTFGNLMLDAGSETIMGAGTFNIGSSGNGTLLVLGGATLKTSTTTTFGANLGGIGNAIINGPTSNWTATNLLSVGKAGTGTLNVQNGGQVTANALELGELSNSNGTITVGGGGAAFTVTGLANIGGILAAEPAASATLNVGLGGTMNLNGATNLRAAAKVNVTGGLLSLNTLTFAPTADVNWTSGTIKFANGNAITQSVLALLLEATSSLGPNRVLAAQTGVMNLDSNLSLDGGRIDVASLTLNANVNVNAFSSINATNAITIAAGRTLQIEDFGTISATTSITNNGILKLNGPLATVATLVTNTAGIIQGTGRFVGGLNNGVAGTIRATENDHLVIQTASTNPGNIQLLGGTLEYTNMLTNAATGFISGRGVFRGSSATPGGIGLTNDGSLALSAGTTDIYGDVTNSASGKIIAAGGSVVTFFDDVVNQGDIRTNVGSRTVFFGDVTGGGSFTGGGDVELNGDLRPGNSPANVIFGGNVDISPTGGLNMELAGITKGAGYDSLTIAGAASLSGALSVSLLGGYVPSFGDVFEIITADDGVDGAFDHETLPFLGGGLLFDVIYESDAVKLAVAGLPGDFNYDGTVDAADYIVWRKVTAPTPVPMTYQTWRNNFNTSISGSGGSTPSVPEPSSFMLIIVAACFAARRTRRTGRFSDQ